MKKVENLALTLPFFFNSFFLSNLIQYCGFHTACSPLRLMIKLITILVVVREGPLREMLSLECSDLLKEVCMNSHSDGTRLWEKWLKQKVFIYCPPIFCYFLFCLCQFSSTFSRELQQLEALIRAEKMQQQVLTFHGLQPHESEY